MLNEVATAATDAAIAASLAADDEALRWICSSPMQIIQLPEEERRGGLVEVSA